MIALVCYLSKDVCVSFVFCLDLHKQCQVYTHTRTNGMLWLSVIFINFVRHSLNERRFKENGGEKNKVM